MNEAQQMNFGKTPLDPLNLCQSLFQVCQGRVKRCGHSVVRTSGPGPLTAFCHCICFKMGPRQDLDVPCWGPLKPETLEVDVCLCPVCSQRHLQIQRLQVWRAAERHFGHSLVGGIQPCPPMSWLSNTTTSTMLTTNSLIQTREQTTLCWSATPAYTCHKT